MVGYTLRHPEKVHNTIIEVMIEGKRPPGRPRNTFIGQIKKDVEAGSYKAPKKIAIGREKWRRGAVN